MKPNLIPFLRYTDAPAAVEWLVRALGFTKRADAASNDASPLIELRFGASALVVRAAAVADGPWSNVRMGVHVCTSDLTETTTVRDPEGNLWSRGPSNYGGGDGDVTIVAERHYRHLASALTWLRETLGFEITFEVPGPGGVPRHVEMRVGAGTLYVSPASGGEGPFGDVTQFVNLVVDDPDRHHAQAKAQGANVLVKPTDTPFGARFYAVRDPENMLWWISTYRPARPGQTGPTQ